MLYFVQSSFLHLLTFFTDFCCCCSYFSFLYNVFQCVCTSIVQSSTLIDTDLFIRLFFFSFSLNFSSLYLAYSSLNFTHNFIHFSTKSKNIQSKCISWSLFINSNYYNANYELNLMIKHEILKHLWIGIGSKL